MVRYMYERAREKEEHFIVEYENLKIFTKVLDKIAKEILGKIKVLV